MSELRISVGLTRKVHQAAKQKAMEEGKTLMAWVEELIVRRLGMSKKAKAAA